MHVWITEQLHMCGLTLIISQVLRNVVEHAHPCTLTYKHTHTYYVFIEICYILLSMQFYRSIRFFSFKTYVNIPSLFLVNIES